MSNTRQPSSSRTVYRFTGRSPYDTCGWVKGSAAPQECRCKVCERHLRNHLILDRVTAECRTYF